MKLITLSRPIVSTLCLSIIVATMSGCNTHRRNTMEDLMEAVSRHHLGAAYMEERGESVVELLTNIKKINNEAILFLGNPGVGKSSLLNSIFQKAVCTSGTSIGRGLTDSKQEYIYDGKKYIDTPGISDVSLQEQAVKEVELALKENSDCKVVFVVTLESGRIKPDDLTTINLVLNAVSVDLEYGIVINKVSNRVSRRLGRENKLMTWSPYLKELKRQPSSIATIRRFEEMEDEENVYLPIDSEDRKELINFITALSPNRILAEQVQAIEAQKIRLKREAEEIEKELQEEKIRQAEYQRQLNLERERQRELERERERLQRDVAEREERERLRRLEAYQVQVVAQTAVVQTAIIGCNVM